MQHYHLRDYEMTLLGELQRQQNSAQFCDTLLQTEGISVPTHSCVLAALSPYLSQKLSATPSPPSGQKRQLHLKSLKAHTLLKMVGLLYSGELEVKGSVEQYDFMDAVQTFGLTPLIEREKNDATKEVEPQENRARSSSTCCMLTVAGRESARCGIMKDAQVHPEMAGWKDTHHSVAKRSCVSTGTQTPFENQTKSVTPEHITFQPDKIVLDVCESHSHQASASGRNPVSNDKVSSNRSCNTNNDASFSQGPHNECSDSTGSTHVLAQTKDKNKTSRDEVKKMPEEKNANPTERLPAFAKIAKKNLAKMKVMESTQFSVKVKLRRRRTKEKIWEVVSHQDEDETTSGFAPSSQEAHPTAAQTLHNQVPQAKPSNSTKLPSQPNTISEPSHNFVDCSAPHQNGTLQSEPDPQPQGLAEESDEQIERLLEDIMMGLNILPDLGVPEGDTGQSKILSAAPSAECQYYQNIVERSAHKSTYTAQKQLNCKSVPLIDPSGVKIPQQPFLLDFSTMSSVGQTNRLSHHDRNYPPVQERQPLSSFLSPCWSDLRLPRCLSPIDPFTSVGIDDSAHQLSRFARPLLTEHSGLLVFPLSHREEKPPPLLKTHQNCWQMQCLKQMEYEPQQSRSCILPCTKNRVGVCPTAAERKSYPQKIKRTLVHKKGVAMDGNAPPKKRKVCVDYPQDATGSISDIIKSKKSMNICSVSLSRNNVLAKERSKATGSPKSPPVCAEQQNQQSNTNGHLKERTRAIGSPKSTNTRQSRIKTRGFLKTTQVPPSDTCTQSITDANSEVQRPTVASNQVHLFKKKRGRPSKKMKALFPPNTAPLVMSKSEDQKKIEEELLKIDLEKSKITKRRGQKMRNARGEEVVALESVKSVADNKPDDDNAPKRMAAFKNSQTFVRDHNLKKKSDESQEVSKKILNTDDHEDIDIIQLQDESSVNVSVSVENHSQILNESTENGRLQRQGSGSSCRKGATFFSDEQPSVDMLKRAFAQHAERDQTEKTHIQELKSVVVPPENNNPGCSPSDRQPCPKNRMSLEPNVNPQISTCLSAVTGSPKSPECSKEEIFEVDVMLSSPERMPFTRQREYVLTDIETTQSEEEGEIDVTGDEID